MGKSAANMGKAGRVAAGGFGTAMLGIAKSAALAGVIVGGVAIKMASDFDKPMRQVWSLTTTSEDKFNQWSKTVLDMSKKFPFPAKDMANALYYIKSAMPDATEAQIFNVLGITAKGAVAGVAELSDSAKALVGVMNAYKDIRPEYYMDIMSKAAERSGVKLQDFVANMGAVVGTSADANVPFQQVAAAFATLTKAGVPANTAMMAINRTLVQYYKPSVEAAKVGKELGIEFSRSHLQAVGLQGALLEVMAAFEKAPDAIGKLFPNIRAMKAVFPLVGKASQMFAQDLVALGGASGTMNRMFSRNMKSMENSIKLMVNKGRALLIQLGQKIFPIVKKGIDALGNAFEGKNNVVNAFANAIKGVGSFILGVGQTAAKAAPEILTLVAAFATLKIVPIVGAAITAVGEAGLVLPGVFGTMAAAVGLAGISVGEFVAAAAPFAAAAAIAAGGGLLIAKHFRDADKAGQDAWDSLQAYDKELGTAATSAQPLLNQMNTLRTQLAGLTPDTQAYVDVHKQLLDVQTQLVSVYPGLISGMQMEGGVLKTNTEDMQRQIKIRRALMGGPAETKGLIGPAAGLEKSITGFDELNTQISEYDKGVAGVTAKLESYGATTDQIKVIQSAFAESAAKGWEEVKHSLMSYENIKQGYGAEAGTFERRDINWRMAKLQESYTQMSKWEGEWKDQKIANSKEARLTMLKEYQDYTIALEQLRVSAKAAGEAKGAAPEGLIPLLAPQVKNTYLKAQATQSADIYIQSYFQGLYKGSAADLPAWSASLRDMLTAGKFTEAFDAAGAQGASGFVTNWVTQMVADQGQVAAATGKISTTLAGALSSTNGEIRLVAASGMRDVIAVMAATLPKFGALGQAAGLDVANQMADGIKNQNILPGALDQQGQEAMIRLAQALGTTSMLSQPLKDLAAKLHIDITPTIKLPTDVPKMDIFKWLGGKTEQTVSVKVSDGGTGGKTKKSIDQVKAAAEELAAVDPTVDIGADDRASVKIDALRALNGKTIATVNIVAKIIGSGPFTADEYARYLESKISGISPTIGVGGSAVADQLDALEKSLSSAKAALSGDVPDSWLWRMMQSDILEVNQAIMYLTGNNQAAVDMWGQVAVAYNAAKTQVDTLKTAIDGLNQKMKTSQDAVTALNEKLSASQERLSKYQTQLSNLGQISIKGEGAYTEKSAKLQQRINETQLDLVKAERSHNYAKAAGLQLTLDDLNQRKQIVDLESSVKYDEKKRKIQEALDPLSKQEMSYKNILKHIRAAQWNIAHENATQASINKKIKTQQNIQKGLQRQLDITQKQYDLANTRLGELETKMQNIEGSITRAAQAAQTFAKALQDAAAAGEPAPVWNPLGFQKGGMIPYTGWFYGHKGEEVVPANQVNRGFGLKPISLQTSHQSTINVPVYLDSKMIGRAVAKVTGKTASAYAKSGGRY
jgi:TP901 family phage tail tape measure protein